MSDQNEATVGADAEADAGEGGKPMSFWEHLEELRRRLIWSAIAFFVGCFAAWGIHDELFLVLRKPFDDAWIAQKLAGDPAFHYNSPQGAFVAFFRISMIGGFVLAAPFVFYQVWSFIAPGLYSKEKRYIIPFVLFSTLLFVGGGYFGWRVAFPISFSYFLSLAGGSAEGGVIVPTIMMAEYIDFCTQMLLGFGLVFELPMLLLFLSIAGLINYLQLITFGRYFILIAFIVAAIFTPPDVPDQLAMAIPMCLLYVVSIGLVYLFGKPPTEAQKAAFRARRKKVAAT